MGGRRVGTLKARMSRERCNSGVRWTRLNSGGIQAGRARIRRHSVDKHGTFRKIRDAARRKAPGVRAHWTFESRE